MTPFFPYEGYSSSFSTIIKLDEPQYSTKGNNPYPLLFLKDPIGKVYYSDKSEEHLYRPNTAESAWDYDRVKSHFKKTLMALRGSNKPDFDLMMNDISFTVSYSTYNTKREVFDF